MAVGCVAAFSSGPGQSYGFAVFIDPLTTETGLSRTGISLLYALGTGVSALAVVVAGRAVDRFGARMSLPAIAAGLAVACLLMAAAQGPALVLLGFAGLRALGQGSIPVTVVVLVAQWFRRRRGRAMAFIALGYAASNAALPPVAQALIDAVGWRSAYVILGAAVCVLVIPPALLLVRDRPETIGLAPDGDPRPSGEPAPRGGGQPGQRMPIGRLLRSPAFWLLALPCAVAPFIATAAVFHQIALLGSRGLAPEAAAAVFTPYALGWAASTFFAGWLVDRFGPKRVLLGNLALLALSLTLLLVVDSVPLAIAYALLLGSAGGGQMVVSGTIWAHYYGRDHLGSVQGPSGMVLITGAALAPLVLASVEAVATFDVAILALLPVPFAAMAMLAVHRPTAGSSPSPG